MSGLHVVMTISSFRPVVGGGERQAERLAGSLVRRGHRVTVLTRRSSPALPSEEQLDTGVHVVRVAGHGRADYALSMLRWIGARRRSIDVVHAQQSNSPLVAAVGSTRLWSLPSVCTPMTAHPELGWAGTARVGARARRWWYRPTTRWIAKSDEIARLLEPYAAGCVDRIPNGVDTDTYSPGPRRAGGPPTALFVGRLDRPKRVDLLLDAWARAGSHARLRLVGDGPLRGELEERSRALGLRGVEFLGTRDDVVALLREADLFVLPSDLEGMPNALLEAMSCGLACVASAVGAVPELLGDGAGLCVPPGDARALAAVLGRLLAQPGERARLGREGRRRAQARFSLGNVAGLVEASYRQAIAAGRR